MTQRLIVRVGMNMQRVAVRLTPRTTLLSLSEKRRSNSTTARLKHSLPTSESRVTLTAFRFSSSPGVRVRMKLLSMTEILSAVSSL